MSEKPKHIDFKYNLKLYLGLLKNYRWLTALLILSILIVEAVDASTKYLFKIIVDNGTSYVAGTSTLASVTSVFMIVAGVYIGINILRYFLSWLNIHLLNRLDGGLIFDLKQRFFNHILNLSHSFHTTHKTGSLISRLTRGGRAMERMTDLILTNVLPMIFQMVIVTATLAFFDLTSSIIIVVTSIVFIIYSYIFQRMQQPSSVAANDAEDFEKGNIADFFTNIDSIKYFGKEKFISNRYETISKDSKKHAIINWDYYRWIDSGQGIIIGIGTFFVIYFPLLQFLNGDLTIGTLVLIYTMYAGVISPLFRFTYAMRQYYAVMADFESLFEYDKIQQEITDKKGAKPLNITRGEVNIDDITFAYGKRKIFEGFSLKVPANKKIALVGHSGSGKSTIVKLLYRLYDVDKGSIRIDGVDIKDIKQESLRSEMSIVPQEAVLFDDTIYNNILFSRPQATKKEVMDAIRFAQLDKIIEEFPNKEDTVVGERGVKLSGGEKQRVSIARAILADKRILILDEATSSLDSETEHEIQKDLARLMKNRTSIIIAHRLSTIMSADIIIVMKRGNIIQKGTHRTLIKKEGEYRKLWNLQKGGYLKS